MKFQDKNYDWVASLSGRQGVLAREQAHEALANYLFVVVQTFLIRRQSHFLWLAGLADHEIAALAEDLVQICLEKLNRNDSSLLRQFAGKGSFTSWAAQIALNAARSELRRVRWNRLQPLDGLVFSLAAETPGPEQIFQRQQVVAALNRCLDQLSDSHYMVLVRCVINGESAADIAQDLKRTVQAVYSLAHRAKQRLAMLMEEEQLGPETLADISPPHVGYLNHH